MRIPDLFLRTVRLSLRLFGPAVSCSVTSVLTALSCDQSVVCVYNLSGVQELPGCPVAGLVPSRAPVLSESNLFTLHAAATLHINTAHTVLVYLHRCSESGPSAFIVDPPPYRHDTHNLASPHATSFSLSLPRHPRAHMISERARTAGHAQLP